MSDKKIIVISLVLAAILVAGGWFLTKNKPNINPGPAAIGVNNNQPATTLAGISLSDENAPLLIEEYTNFLCPACGVFALSTLPKINDEYIKTGRVRMVFYITPPFETSQAGFCAAKQDKFLAFHDYIFSHQGEITKEEDIFSMANAAGLDKNEFEKCYASSEALTVAQTWYSEGGQRGMAVTPTFFVKGKKIEGAKTYDEFKAIIEEALK